MSVPDAIAQSDIKLPENLHWLSFVAGGEWPTGSENGMFALSDAWSEASAALAALENGIEDAINDVLAAYPSAAELNSSMVQTLKHLTDESGDASLQAIAKSMNDLAKSCDQVGCAIQENKIMIIVGLVQLVWEIAVAWLFPPTAPVQEVVLIAWYQVLFRWLKQTVLFMVVAALKAMGQQMILNILLQLGQMAAGHRDGFDGKALGQYALGGALGGAFGSLFGKIGGDLFKLAGGKIFRSEFDKRWQQLLVGFVEGGAGGVGGMVGGGVANQIINGGPFELDPRMLGAGAAGAFAGGARGWRSSGVKPHFDTPETPTLRPSPGGGPVLGDDGGSAPPPTSKIEGPPNGSTPTDQPPPSGRDEISSPGSTSGGRAEAHDQSSSGAGQRDGSVAANSGGATGRDTSASGGGTSSGSPSSGSSDASGQQNSTGRNGQAGDSVGEASGTRSGAGASGSTVGSGDSAATTPGTGAGAAGTGASGAVGSGSGASGAAASAGAVGSGGSSTAGAAGSGSGASATGASSATGANQAGSNANASGAGGSNATATNAGGSQGNPAKAGAPGAGSAGTPQSSSVGASAPTPARASSASNDQGPTGVDARTSGSTAPPANRPSAPEQASVQSKAGAPDPQPSGARPKTADTQQNGGDRSPAGTERTPSSVKPRAGDSTRSSATADSRAGGAGRQDGEAGPASAGTRKRGNSDAVDAPDVGRRGDANPANPSGRAGGEGDDGTPVGAKGAARADAPEGVGNKGDSDAVAAPVAGGKGEAHSGDASDGVGGKGNPRSDEGVESGSRDDGSPTGTRSAASTDAAGSAGPRARASDGAVADEHGPGDTARVQTEDGHPETGGAGRSDARWRRVDAALLGPVWPGGKAFLRYLIPMQDTIGLIRGAKSPHEGRDPYREPAGNDLELRPGFGQKKPSGGKIDDDSTPGYDKPLSRGVYRLTAEEMAEYRYVCGPDGRWVRDPDVPVRQSDDATDTAQRPDRSNSSGSEDESDGSSAPTSSASNSGSRQSNSASRGDSGSEMVPESGTPMTKLPRSGPLLERWAGRSAPVMRTVIGDHDGNWYISDLPHESFHHAGVYTAFKAQFVDGKMTAVYDWAGAYRPAPARVQSALGAHYDEIAHYNHNGHRYTAADREKWPPAAAPTPRAADRDPASDADGQADRDAETTPPESAANRPPLPDGMAWDRIDGLGSDPRALTKEQFRTATTAEADLVVLGDETTAYYIRRRSDAAVEDGDAPDTGWRRVDTDEPVERSLDDLLADPRLTSVRMPGEAEVSLADPVPPRDFEAVAHRLVEEYQPQDWSGLSRDDLREALAGGKFHSSTDPDEVAAYERAVTATIELIRRETAKPDGDGGKTLYFTQVMAAMAMRHGPINMAAGEGKTLAFLADAILHVGSGESLQVFTTRDTLAHDAYTLYQKVLGPYGFKIGRMNPDDGPDNAYPVQEDGEPTVYIGTLNDAGFGHLRGKVVPGRMAVLDEIDEALVHAETTWIISDGVAQPAPAGTVDAVIRAKQFLDQQLESGALRPEHFGRGPEQIGGSARLTEEGLATVTKLLDPDGSADPQVLEAEVRRINSAATARWEFVENDHYIIDRSEGKIVIIDQTTHGLLRDPKTATESRWNGGLAQAVEAKHGLQIRADSSGSRSVTAGELFSDENYTTVSGASGTAEGVAGALSDRYGMPDVVEIPRYRASKLRFLEDVLSVDQAGKHRQIADHVAAEYGPDAQPQLVIVNRNSEAAPISALLTARNVEHTVVDAQWFLDNGVHAQDRLTAIFAEAGERGKVLVINRQGGRGVDIAVSDAVSATGGLKVLVSGRSSLHDIDIQAENRAARNGQEGSVRYFMAADDTLFAHSPQHAVTVTRYTDAVAAHERAETRHQQAQTTHETLAASKRPVDSGRLDQARADLEATRVARDRAHTERRAAEADMVELVSTLQRHNGAHLARTNLASTQGALAQAEQSTSIPAPAPAIAPSPPVPETIDQDGPGPTRDDPPAADVPGDRAPELDMRTPPADMTPTMPVTVGEFPHATVLFNDSTGRLVTLDTMDPLPVLPSDERDGVRVQLPDGASVVISAELSASVFRRVTGPDGAEQVVPVTTGVFVTDNDGDVLQLLPTTARVRPDPGHEGMMQVDPGGGIGWLSVVPERLGIDVRPSAGALFGGVDGLPAIEDLRNGVAATSYLLSDLRALATRVPGLIKDMIRVRTDADGKRLFSVRFFDAAQGRWVWVTVDDTFYADASGALPYGVEQPGQPLWPAVFEKAFAVFRGGEKGFAGVGTGRARIATEATESSVASLEVSHGVLASIVREPGLLAMLLEWANRFFATSVRGTVDATRKAFAEFLIREVATATDRVGAVLDEQGLTPDLLAALEHTELTVLLGERTADAVREALAQRPETGGRAEFLAYLGAHWRASVAALPGQLDAWKSDAETNDGPIAQRADEQPDRPSSNDGTEAVVERATEATTPAALGTTPAAPGTTPPALGTTPPALGTTPATTLGSAIDGTAHQPTGIDQSTAAGGPSAVAASGTHSASVLGLRGPVRQHASSAARQFVPPPELPSELTMSGSVVDLRNRADQTVHWWDQHGGRWWNALRFNTLPPAEQYELVTRYHRLRKLDGIPVGVRDTLNRTYLRAELSRLTEREQAGQLTANEQRLISVVRAVDSTLTDAGQVAAWVAERSGIATPQVFLQRFEPQAFGGTGSLILSFGDTDLARSVVWHVPGAEQSAGPTLRPGLELGADRYAALEHQDARGRSAVVVWLGHGGVSGSDRGTRARRWVSSPLVSGRQRFADALTTFGVMRHGMERRGLLRRPESVEVVDRRWGTTVERTGRGMDPLWNAELSLPRAELHLTDPVVFTSTEPLTRGRQVRLAAGTTVPMYRSPDRPDQVLVRDPAAIDDATAWHAVPERMFGTVVPTLVWLGGPLFAPDGIPRETDVVWDNTEIHSGAQYLHAELIDLVRERPGWVRRMVRERPDGVFEVRFTAPDGTAQRVAVDRRFYAYDGRIAYGAHVPGQPLWPAVLEKAWTLLRGPALGDAGEGAEFGAVLRGGATVLGDAMVGARLPSATTALRPAGEWAPAGRWRAGSGVESREIAHPMRMDERTLTRVLGDARVARKILSHKDSWRARRMVAGNLEIWEDARARLSWFRAEGIDTDPLWSFLQTARMYDDAAFARALMRTLGTEGWPYAGPLRELREHLRECGPAVWRGWPAVFDALLHAESATQFTNWMRHNDVRTEAGFREFLRQQLPPGDFERPALRLLLDSMSDWESDAPQGDTPLTRMAGGKIRRLFERSSTLVVATRPRWVTSPADTTLLGDYRYLVSDVVYDESTATVTEVLLLDESNRQTTVPARHFNQFAVFSAFGSSERQTRRAARMWVPPSVESPISFAPLGAWSNEPSLEPAAIGPRPRRLAGPIFAAGGPTEADLAHLPDWSVTRELRARVATAGSIANMVRFVVAVGDHAVAVRGDIIYARGNRVDSAGNVVHDATGDVVTDYVGNPVGDGVGNIVRDSDSGLVIDNAAVLGLDVLLTVAGAPRWVRVGRSTALRVSQPDHAPIWPLLLLEAHVAVHGNDRVDAARTSHPPADPGYLVFERQQGPLLLEQGLPADVAAGTAPAASQDSATVVGFTGVHAASAAQTPGVWASMRGGAEAATVVASSSALVEGVRAPRGGVWKSMPGDGNCLFHALATLLGMNDEGAHDDLRAAVVEGLSVKADRQWAELFGAFRPGEPEAVRQASFVQQLSNLLRDKMFREPAAEFLLPFLVRELGLNVDIVRPAVDGVPGVTTALRHGGGRPVFTLLRATGAGDGHYHVAVDTDGAPLRQPPLDRSATATEPATDRFGDDRKPIAHNQIRASARILLDHRFAQEMAAAHRDGAAAGLVAVREQLARSEHRADRLAARVLDRFVLASEDVRVGLAELEGRRFDPTIEQLRALRAAGLELRRVAQDGNCLFTAFVTAVNSHKDPASVRAEALDHIRANRQRFLDLYHPAGVEQERERAARFDRELAELGVDGAFNNDLADLLIKAIQESQSLPRPIVVVDERFAPPVDDLADADCVLVRVDYAGGHYHAATGAYSGLDSMLALPQDWLEPRQAPTAPAWSASSARQAPSLAEAGAVRAVPFPARVVTNGTLKVTLSDGELYEFRSGAIDKDWFLRDIKTGEIWVSTTTGTGRAMIDPTAWPDLEVRIDPPGDMAELRWSGANPGLRFAAVGDRAPVAIEDGATWLALFTADGGLVVQDPNRTDGRWHRVPVALEDVLTLVVPANRNASPLFDNDMPSPNDVEQGTIGDCYLLSVLKNMATHAPWAIKEMIHEYEDGTVGVRLFRADGPTWVHVDKKIYINRYTRHGHYAGHRAGYPIWPALIEKAYAAEFGGFLGYLGISNGGEIAYAASALRQGFQETGSAGRVLPPATAGNSYFFLHPSSFGPDALHEQFGPRDDAGRDADPKREFATALVSAMAQRQRLLETTLDALGRQYAPSDPAYLSVWRQFESDHEFQTPLGMDRLMRETFDRDGVSKWAVERARINRYMDDIYATETHLRSAARYPILAREFAARIDYALSRGDQVLLGTPLFGPGKENASLVPGLVGTHAYSVIGVEHDARGNPVRVVMDNPWNMYPAAVPGPGIEYRPNIGRGVIAVDVEHLAKFDRVATQGRATAALHVAEFRYHAAVNHAAVPDAVETVAEVGDSLRGGADETTVATELNRVVEGVAAPAGLVWKSMPGGGNCLFHAMAAMLRMPGETAHEDLRAEVVVALHQRAAGAWNGFFDGFLDDAPEAERRKAFQEQLAVLLQDGAYQDAAAEFFLPYVVRTLELNVDIARPGHLIEHLRYGADGPVHTVLRATGDGAGHYHVAVGADGVVPAEPAPGQIGSNGVRRFETNSDGALYATRYLAGMRDFQGTEWFAVRQAVHAYERNTWVNLILRSIAGVDSVEAEIGAYVERLRQAVRAIEELKGEDHYALPTVEELEEDRTLLIEDGATVETSARLRLIEEVLNDARRDTRLADLQEKEELHDSLLDYYGVDEVTPAPVLRQARLLDQATVRSLRLFEPIQVIRVVDTIGFMLDADGQPLGDGDPRRLIGTIQTERGYLSTSVGAETIVASDSDYCLELVVWPGAHGMYIGALSAAPGGDQQELVLPRGTSYRINDVRVAATGRTILTADVLLPPAAVADNDAVGTALPYRGGGQVLSARRARSARAASTQQRPTLPRVRAGSARRTRDVVGGFVGALGQVLRRRRGSAGPTASAPATGWWRRHRRRARVPLAHVDRNDAVRVDNPSAPAVREPTPALETSLEQQVMVPSPDAPVPVADEQSVPPDELAGLPADPVHSVVDEQAAVPVPDGSVPSSAVAPTSSSESVSAPGDSVASDPTGPVLAPAVVGHGADHAARQQFLADTEELVPPPSTTPVTLASVPLPEGLVFRRVSEQTRAEYRLVVGSNGRLYRAVDGSLFDTTWGARMGAADPDIFGAAQWHQHPANRRALLVLDVFGNIYAIADAQQPQTRLTHASLLHGAAATAALEVEVRQGIPMVFAYRSGEYQIPDDLNQEALAWLTAEPYRLRMHRDARILAPALGRWWEDEEVLPVDSVRDDFEAAPVPYDGPISMVPVGTVTNEAPVRTPRGEQVRLPDPGLRTDRGLAMVPIAGGLLNYIDTPAAQRTIDGVDYLWVTGANGPGWVAQQDLVNAGFAYRRRWARLAQMITVTGPDGPVRLYGYERVERAATRIEEDGRNSVLLQRLVDDTQVWVHGEGVEQLGLPRWWELTGPAWPDEVGPQLADLEHLPDTPEVAQLRQLVTQSPERIRSMIRFDEPGVVDVHLMVEGRPQWVRLDRSTTLPGPAADSSWDGHPSWPAMVLEAYTAAREHDNEAREFLAIYDLEYADMGSEEYPQIPTAQRYERLAGQVEQWLARHGADLDPADPVQAEYHVPLRPTGSSETDENGETWLQFVEVHRGEDASETVVQVRRSLTWLTENHYLYLEERDVFHRIVGGPIALAPYVMDRSAPVLRHTPASERTLTTAAVDEFDATRILPVGASVRIRSDINLPHLVVLEAAGDSVTVRRDSLESMGLSMPQSLGGPLWATNGPSVQDLADLPASAAVRQLRALVGEDPALVVTRMRRNLDGTVDVHLMVDQAARWVRVDRVSDLAWADDRPIWPVLFLRAVTAVEEGLLENFVADDEVPLIGDTGVPVPARSTTVATELDPVWANAAYPALITDEQLEQLRLVVGQDGRLYRAGDGVVFDTAGRRALFVMDRYANIYAAQRLADTESQVTHASMLRGTPATAAAEVVVRAGVIQMLVDRGGEYPNTTRYNDEALDYLIDVANLRLAPNLLLLGFDAVHGREVDRTQVSRGARLLFNAPRLYTAAGELLPPHLGGYLLHPDHPAARRRHNGVDWLWASGAGRTGWLRTAELTDVGYRWQPGTGRLFRGVQIGGRTAAGQQHSIVVHESERVVIDENRVVDDDGTTWVRLMHDGNELYILAETAHQLGTLPVTPLIGPLWGPRGPVPADLDHLPNTLPIRQLWELTQVPEQLMRGLVENRDGTIDVNLGSGWVRVGRLTDLPWRPDPERPIWPAIALAASVSATIDGLLRDASVDADLQFTALPVADQDEQHIETLAMGSTPDDLGDHQDLPERWGTPDLSSRGARANVSVRSVLSQSGGDGAQENLLSSQAVSALRSFLDNGAVPAQHNAQENLFSAEAQDALRSFVDNGVAPVTGSPLEPVDGPTPRAASTPGNLSVPADAPAASPARPAAESNPDQVVVGDSIPASDPAESESRPAEQPTPRNDSATSGSGPVPTRSTVPTAPDTIAQPDDGAPGSSTGARVLPAGPVPLASEVGPKMRSDPLRPTQRHIRLPFTAVYTDREAVLRPNAFGVLRSPNDPWNRYTDDTGTRYRVFGANGAGWVWDASLRAAGFRLGADGETFRYAHDLPGIDGPHAVYQREDVVVDESTGSTEQHAGALRLHLRGRSIWVDESAAAALGLFRPLPLRGPFWVDGGPRAADLDGLRGPVFGQLRLLAHQHPEFLRDMFRVQDSGSVDVRLLADGRARWVRVARFDSRGRDWPADRPTWPLLVVMATEEAAWHTMTEAALNDLLPDHPDLTDVDLSLPPAHAVAHRDRLTLRGPQLYLHGPVPPGPLRLTAAEVASDSPIIQAPNGVRVAMAAVRLTTGDAEEIDPFADGSLTVDHTAHGDESRPVPDAGRGWRWVVGDDSQGWVDVVELARHGFQQVPGTLELRRNMTLPADVTVYDGELVEIAPGSAADEMVLRRADGTTVSLDRDTATALGLRFPHRLDAPLWQPGGPREVDVAGMRPMPVPAPQRAIEQLRRLVSLYPDIITASVRAVPEQDAVDVRMVYADEPRWVRVRLLGDWPALPAGHVGWPYIVLTAHRLLSLQTTTPAPYYLEDSESASPTRSASEAGFDEARPAPSTGRGPGERGEESTVSPSGPSGSSEQQRSGDAPSGVDFFDRSAFGG